MKTIFRSRLTDVDSAAIDIVGDLRFEQDKIYKYVQLKNTTATVAGVAGDMVAYDKEDGAKNNIVVTDNNDADTKPVGAGALLATVVGTLAVGEFIWIQVTGPNTVNQTLAGTPTDGDALFLSTTDKTLTLATAADDPICAVAQDESAKEVILRCPF